MDYARKGVIPMGDRKGKKDKAKGQRQKKAKQAKAAKRKQDKQQPHPPLSIGVNKTVERD
jgi:hypothetical protein